MSAAPKQPVDLAARRDWKALQAVLKTTTDPDLANTLIAAYYRLHPIR